MPADLPAGGTYHPKAMPQIKQARTLKGDSDIGDTERFSHFELGTKQINCASGLALGSKVEFALPDIAGKSVAPLGIHSPEKVSQSILNQRLSPRNCCVLTRLSKILQPALATLA